MSDQSSAPKGRVHQHVVIICVLIAALVIPFNRMGERNGSDPAASGAESVEPSSAADESDNTLIMGEAFNPPDPQSVGLPGGTTVSTERYPSPHSNSKSNRLNGGASVTAVGDSLMVGATPHLGAALKDFNVQAEVGIQMDEGIAFLRGIVEQDKLGDILLVSLGSNGPIDDGQIDTIMDLADGRRVFAMNVVVARSWEGSVNQTWANATKRHDNLHVVDWRSYVSEHPGVLRPDGVHPTQSGYSSYAQLLLDELPDSCKR
ncbi:MAG: hypothetical protein ACOX2M_01615 [Fastidiosipilaceae bacterium]